MESERRPWWKLVLLCVAALSTALLLITALAVLSPPYVSFDPSLSCIRSWVSPLYIFLAVNFIIFAIYLLSSSLPRLLPEEEEDTPSTAPLEKSGSWDTFRLLGEANTCDLDKLSTSTTALDKVNARTEEDKVNAEAQPAEGKEEDPPESSMDDTWQAIVEGRRGLERSRTMAPARRLERIDDRRAKEKEVKKWRTFNDRLALTRKESMSPEELSLRAEAFIKKVNDDMRLQRLESDQRFMDMVNRGL